MDNDNKDFGLYSIEFKDPENRIFHLPPANFDWTKITIICGNSGKEYTCLNTAIFDWISEEYELE